MSNVAAESLQKYSIFHTTPSAERHKRKRNDLYTSLRVAIVILFQSPVPT
jgi:hypothetical protein